MCDINLIAGLLIAASIAIGGAEAAAIIICIYASNIWTAATGTPSLFIAGGLAAVALGLVGAAIAQVAKCSGPPCTAVAGTLQNTLIGLSVAITIFTAAAVTLAIGAGTPWVGIAIGATMGAAALAIGITLIVASTTQLPALDACRGAASSLVTAQRTVGFIAGIISILAGLFFAASPLAPFLPAAG